MLTKPVVPYQPFHWSAKTTWRVLYNILTVTEYCTSINLNKGQEPLAYIGHVFFCSVTGGAWLTENVKFYFTRRFPFLFFHSMTCCFSIDKHKKWLNVLFLKVFFNRFVECLVKPLGAPSSNVNQWRYRGSIPEVGRQNKLYNHNEEKMFLVVLK